ncbi:hypothetical protein SCAR479_13152 [Seiridium cardinale]|uniref:Zn(2)-C6 fungal-type domain-containing protein n=1 Tax=Seiridium cardinale TaxID=138064 RepID=A0ABR2X8V6_9PEZI
MEPRTLHRVICEICLRSPSWPTVSILIRHLELDPLVRATIYAPICFQLGASLHPGIDNPSRDRRNYYMARLFGSVHGVVAHGAESELTNLRVRKVKCDETKPACVRCTSTGRKCDGYPTELKPGLTWYRPNHLFLSIDRSTEGRALQFFCETAGPYLSGPLDSYFWTHLVLQASNFEPTVRHSLVAISSLYEDSYCNAKTANQLHANTFALRHYNAAIENLRKLDNEPLTLLVCILFVCIEILQNNRDSRNTAFPA